MKKILSIVMIMLFITTTTVVAKSNQYGELITNRGTAFIMNDVNQNVELHPGLTAGQWKNVLESFCQKKFGQDFETVYNNSVVVDGEHPRLFNTYWRGGRACASPCMSINKAYRTYKGEAWIVEQCAQPLSSDAGMIDNSIREGLSQSLGQGSVKEDNKTDDDQSDKQETTNKKQNTNMETGWIILALILGLGIIAAIIAIVLGGRNNRQAAMTQVQNEFTNTANWINTLNTNAVNTHYTQVGQFQTAANQMNINAATNARDVHNTWTTINPPANPAGNGGAH